MNSGTLHDKPVTVKAMSAAYAIISENIKQSEFTDNVKNYLRLCFNNFVFGKGIDMFDYLPNADMTFGDFSRKLQAVPERAFGQQGYQDQDMKEQLSEFLQEIIGGAIAAARTAMRQSPERTR